MFSDAADQICQVFDSLKSILDSPRLHIANHFTDLRHQIDLEFQTFIRNSNDLEIERHSDYMTVILNEVQMFEVECLKNSLMISGHLLEMTKGRVKQIEHELEKCSAGSIEIDEHTYYEINELIYECLLEIEREIYMSKQMIFLTKDNDLIEFPCKSYYSSFGLLVIIENEYIGTRALLQQ